MIAYQPRPTRCVGVTKTAHWQLKRYEMGTDRDPLPTAISAAADAVVADTLAAEPADELGAGFVILHSGAEAIWLLIDLWRGDIVCQRGFRAPLAPYSSDNPITFIPIEPGGPTVCVWEMEILSHERDAYVKHVLRPNTPDVAAYLADRFDNTSDISNRELVERFHHAWAAANLDALMATMTAEPTYRASTGAEPGRTHTGAKNVRAGMAAVIEAEAGTEEAPPIRIRLHAFDDRVLSFWSYAAPNLEGATVEIEGVDVWSFDQGRIAVKDAYRKSFPDFQPGS